MRRQLDAVNASASIRLINALEAGARILHSRDASVEWFLKPSAALRHKTPLSAVVESSDGAVVVESVLARLAYGP